MNGVTSNDYEYLYLADTLQALKEHDQPVEGIDKNIIEGLISHMYAKYYGHSWAVPKTFPFFIKSTVCELDRIMRNIIQDIENKRTFHVYSCHDYNLLPLLCFFKILEKPIDPIPFGSYLIFELYHVRETEKRNYQNYRLRILHMGNPIREPWAKVKPRNSI